MTARVIGSTCERSLSDNACHEVGTQLTAAGYEEDTETAQAELLAHAGFTGDQAQELQLHRIRWPPMGHRRELNSPLDELVRRLLYCNREQLTEIVYSPVRKPVDRWIERLQWLLMTDGFGFCSTLSREEGPPMRNTVHLRCFE